MTLHLFNPDHDLALAANTPHFIAPRAGRRLRHDLAFLPALWAEPGDLVLVPDATAAADALRRIGVEADVEWVEPEALARRLAAADAAPTTVSPWGWNATLREELLALGVAPAQLPPPESLATLRAMSHRGWAARHLLAPLRALPDTVGQSMEVHSAAEVEARLPLLPGAVLKLPWSSSGRGLRYVYEHEYGAVPQLTPHVAGWVANGVRRQGSVMLEPCYDRVADFGMEFAARPDGTVDYLGLSLFSTLHGAYAGNVVDTEAHKEAALARWIPADRLRRVQSVACHTLAPLLRGRYAGPFGIDMMVVWADGRHQLHPCVELNLRRTMGHVALALARRLPHLPATMRIAYDEGYRLEVKPPPIPLQ